MLRQIDLLLLSLNRRGSELKRTWLEEIEKKLKDFRGKEVLKWSKLHKENENRLKEPLLKEKGNKKKKRNEPRETEKPHFNSKNKEGKRKKRKERLLNKKGRCLRSKNEREK